MTTRKCPRFSVTGAILLAGVLGIGSFSAAQGQETEFEVKKGYLSSSIRELVDGYGWSLVWEAGEDRVIDHPFTIQNFSMEDSLTVLLEMYRGQFVADLFRGNRVVLINTPPPRVAVDLPGTEAALADEVADAAAPPAADDGEAVPYTVEADTEMHWEFIEEAEPESEAADGTETASVETGVDPAL